MLSDSDDEDGGGWRDGSRRRVRQPQREREYYYEDDDDGGAEAFERHVVIARNTKAALSDPFRLLSGLSGDGKSLRRLLFARPDKIHADRLLRILVGIKDLLGGRNKGWHQFDCAEPHAVANHASLGVPLEHIVLDSIKTEGGETRPPCTNCQQWLEEGNGGWIIKKSCLDRSWRDRYRIGLGRMSGATLKRELGL